MKKNILGIFLLTAIFSSAFAQDADDKEVLDKTLFSPFINFPDSGHVIGYSDGYEVSVNPPYSFKPIKLMNGNPACEFCYEFSYKDANGNQTRIIQLNGDENGNVTSVGWWASDGTKYTVDKLNKVPARCAYRDVKVLSIKNKNCSKDTKICYGTLASGCGSYSGVPVSCLNKVSGICPSALDCISDPDVQFGEPDSIMSLDTPVVRPNFGSGVRLDGGEAGPGR